MNKIKGEPLKKVGQLWLPQDDLHFTEYLSKYKIYQEPHQKTSIAFCKSFRTAIDVGCHVASWSQSLCQRFSYVYCFEVLPIHIQCIYKNLKSYNNWSLQKYLLGNQNKKFGLEYKKGASSDAFVTKGEDYEMKKLDDFEFKNVDFIKIDVEGFEKQVVEGSEQTIKKWRPTVTLEQKKWSYRFSQPRYSARDLLLKWGMIVRARIIDDWILNWPD